MSDEALLAYEDELATVYQGDCLEVLREMPDASVHCVVTSPPYWGLRDYGAAGQLGLEPTPDEYVARMVEVFREVRRVLRSDGTLWLNLGDSYAGSWGAQSRGNETGEDKVRLEGRSPLNARRISEGAYQMGGAGTGSVKRAPGLKPKDLVGIPWRVAFALQADGWYLRSDIVWSKPNPMPESVTDRPTKAHEYLFLLAKSERYFYDGEAIREPAQYAGPNGARHSPYGQGFTRRSQAGQDRNGAAQIKGGDRYSGFNTRWDQQIAEGTAPLARNKRSVWEIEDHDALLAWLLSRPEVQALLPRDSDVWRIATQPFSGAHFAVFPEKLAEPCILAGCPADGVVLDPFAGSGTTLAVAKRLGRRSVGIELNAAYLDLIRRRVSRVTYQPALFDIAEAAG